MKYLLFATLFLFSCSEDQLSKEEILTRTFDFFTEWGIPEEVLETVEKEIYVEIVEEEKARTKCSRVNSPCCNLEHHIYISKEADLCICLAHEIGHSVALEMYGKIDEDHCAIGLTRQPCEYTFPYDICWR